MFQRQKNIKTMRPLHLLFTRVRITSIIVQILFSGHLGSIRRKLNLGYSRLFRGYCEHTVLLNGLVWGANNGAITTAVHQ